MRDPWRIRCPNCGSTTITKLVEAGGYRCDCCDSHPERALDVKRGELRA